ncbi:TPA: hypothetical protein ACU9K7_003235 [Salmonella enterica]|nr:hypothetical protein [Salmonella enterica subsp. enterica serovar Miami]
MNKTRWLFTVVVSITTLAISTGLIAAPLKGTLSIHQHINPMTCSISQKDYSHSFPTYSKKEILAAAKYAEAVTATLGDKLGNPLNLKMAVVCPDNITSVKVKAIYDNANYFAGKPIVKTNGDGKGVALWVYSSGESDSLGIYWQSDQIRTFNLTSGSGNVGIKVDPYPYYTSKDEIQGGKYSATISLVFDFVEG